MLITVVGNYPKIPNRPRPARLRNAYARLDRGEISPEELARVQDQVTEEVLKEQADAGVELLTDGQIRWEDEQTYVAGGLAGVSINGLIRFFDTNTYYREPVIEGAVAWKSPITLQDYKFAAGKSAKPVKPVLPGPYTLARLSRDEHYRKVDDLTLALAEALNEEAKALQAENPPLIQFNEPAVTRHPEDVGMAAKAWRRLTDGLRVETAVYFYFGISDGAIGAANEAGFTTVGVDMTIPAQVELLQRGPRPQKLGAGVIDSRTTRLEPIEVIVARVREAASLVGPENLYVGPNMGLEFLPREDAQAKLARLSEGVNRAREELR